MSYGLGNECFLSSLLPTEVQKNIPNIARGTGNDGISLRCSNAYSCFISFSTASRGACAALLYHSCCTSFKVPFKTLLCSVWVSFNPIHLRITFLSSSHTLIHVHVPPAFLHTQSSIILHAVDLLDCSFQCLCTPSGHTCTCTQC